MIIRHLGDEWNSANGINNFWHCDKTLTFDKFGVMSASDTIIKQTFCSFERKLAESFKIVNIFSEWENSFIFYENVWRLVQINTFPNNS